MQTISQRSRKKARADVGAMRRIFSVPEGSDSTLIKIENEISRNIQGFLGEHLVAGDQSPAQIEADFGDTNIPEDPIFVSEQADFLLSKVVSQSVHTASPRFIGHMTSALPYFMLPLAKIMMALNQNLVKIETSKAFTPLERQVVGMLHRLVYDCDEQFYATYTQDRYDSLGVFCSGGTVANMTALWVARNELLKAEGTFKGVHEEGIMTALQHYGYSGASILVSKRGHYSLAKAADLLGIGKRNLISVETDDQNKVDLSKLEDAIKDQHAKNRAVIAVVGIAGTTETGHVDPLAAMAELCAAHKIHFHVDAAWGGPTLFSERHRHLLKGIEQADSVAIDAHKQLYVPIGAGLAMFKRPTALHAIEQHANYIIRSGSRDLGKHTLEGSRPGVAMLVHSGLRILGRKGYELLIDRGIERARTFARLIQASPDFELITEPELNLLTYRYVPPACKEALASASPGQVRELNDLLNELTVNIQKEQRDAGKTFVSRTRLEPVKYHKQKINVFRVVLANPLTDDNILKEVLEEQRQIATELLERSFRSRLPTTIQNR